MTDAAREERNKYMRKYLREYRKKNKEKHASLQEAYWERRAAKAQQGKERMKANEDQ